MLNNFDIYYAYGIPLKKKISSSATSLDSVSFVNTRDSKQIKVGI
jgi:hypothetical protein